MNEAQILDVARDAVWTMLLVSGPILLIGLGIGLLISLFQALTSIQEMTLTFVPKILVIFGTMIVFMPYMIRHLTDFTLRLMDIIIGLP
ncbi:flagellar biosynthesis protein FliQ [Novispirillum sp. DQ9]|uniref:flagellar biosynthesis protein FliQ n=1 Tax=Novispirillum sp. DQ9 TaxID=3398612 RepID=UPI003C7AABF4